MQLKVKITAIEEKLEIKGNNFDKRYFKNSQKRTFVIHI